MKFTALLLAGGESRRMGGDKASLLIDGEPLWRRQLGTLQAVHPAEVLISGRADGPYANAGLRIVEDETPGQGPLAGIVSGLAHAEHECLLVLAIDLPRMSAEFLRALIGAAAIQARGVVAQEDGKFEPLAAVYSRSCLPLAREHLQSGDRSLQRFIRAAVGAGLLTSRALTAAEGALFRNINTPADLQAED